MYIYIYLHNIFIGSNNISLRLIIVGKNDLEILKVNYIYVFIQY